MQQLRFRAHVCILYLWAGFGDPERGDRDHLEELVKVDRYRGRGHVINNIKQLSDGLAVVNTVWQFLKKLNVELPHVPDIPFLSVYANKLKTGTQTKTCTHLLKTAPFTMAKGTNDTNVQ